jgi:hypothetical protein
LSRFARFDPLLSGLTRFDPVRFDLIRVHPVLSGFKIRFCPVLSSLIWYESVWSWSFPVLSGQASPVCPVFPVWSGFVWFGPVRLVLFYPVLSGPVWSGPVWSDLMWIRPAWSVWCGLGRICPVLLEFIRFSSVLSCFSVQVQFGPIRLGLFGPFFQFDLVSSGLIHVFPVLSGWILFCPVWSGLIRFYPVRSGVVVWSELVSLVHGLVRPGLIQTKLDQAVPNRNKLN